MSNNDLQRPREGCRKDDHWGGTYLGSQQQRQERSLPQRLFLFLCKSAVAVTDQSEGEITMLLAEISQGSESARERLFALVYEKLHRMANAMMPRERQNHTLQPTGLVHEAYFKLFVGKPLEARGRAYFFGAAANAMRQVLIDYARRIAARPEGQRVPLLDGILDTMRQTHRVDILDLNDALEELKEMHKRHWEVVSLRFFGGLQWREIADCLEVSVSTVEKDWQAARAWLYRRLRGENRDTSRME